MTTARPFAAVALLLGAAAIPGLSTLAADRPATAPTTAPAADVDADLSPAEAADRRRAVDLLRGAWEATSVGDESSAAREKLAAAAAEAAGLLAKDPDSAALLRGAIEASKRAATPAEAVAKLRYGVTDAIRDLTFKPTIEAPFPEGFPAAGPVGRVVVKEYPAYRLARTPVAAGGQDGTFWTLFNHIKANDVAMTAPVEMTYKPAADGKLAQADMAFLYASPKLGKVGEQGKVEVVDVPAMTVVSLGVRGSYTPERMAEAVAKLDKWLAGSKAYERAGDARYMGYNSPMVLPVLRFGEVQVPVKKRG